MPETEKREEPRVAVTFPGTLTLGDRSSPCRVQNMCSRGFLIQAAAGLPVGEVLHLRCELYPERAIECTVQVRHVNADLLGARVIDMNEDGRDLCRRFLEERRAA